jgi:biopolymer transport protein TolR
MGMGTSGNGKSKTAMSEINVTPLVDVMLVLLIMFMVTAPLMQQGIDVDLPKTASSGVDLDSEPMTLVVDQNKVITIAKNPVPMDGLREKLKAIFLNKKNKQIYLQADRRVDYGTVAEVMAEIRAAGIYNIGMITLPKGKD